LVRQPIGAEFARRAIGDSAWDLGNQTLYDLCREHPGHRREDEVLAKVWLIGRSYAASIERRRDGRDAQGDDFYREVVAPQSRRSGIDRWFQPLTGLRIPSADVIVPVHARVTRLFTQISGLEKRSLASKYLHFHFPRVAYIYDERATRATRQVTPAQRLRSLPYDPCDETYARFFLRCEVFRNQLEQLLGCRITPRETDKVLHDPAIVKKLADLGVVTTPGSPEEFARFIAKQTELWSAVIKKAGIRPD